MNARELIQACAIAWVAAIPAIASSAPAAPDAAESRQRAERAAAELAQEFKTLCPVTTPGNQEAFTACKQGLYRDSALRRNLPDYVLWGRQRDPKLTLKESKLTQFGPDVFTGLYFPLFMFNGQYQVDYQEGEKLYRIRFQTAFRNRLAPGQFPYPFWHEAEKWSMYQNANEIIVWWDPSRDRIKAAQYTTFGATPPLVAVELVTPPKFDGQWMWVDADGRSQPKVTVFDGLFRSDNPYLGQLDGAYKNLALRLREGQCNQCHVPNNPDGMKHLVLLQTPAHAAAEIKRLLRAVREDRMPLDDIGIPAPLDPHTKAALLQEGSAFDKLVDAAKQWELARMGTGQVAGVQAAKPAAP
jgi:hypothetical protein